MGSNKNNPSARYKLGSVVALDFGILKQMARHGEDVTKVVDQITTQTMKLVEALYRHGETVESVGYDSQFVRSLHEPAKDFSFLEGNYRPKADRVQEAQERMEQQAKSRDKSGQEKGR